jgi:hypothetical protein
VSLAILVSNTGTALPTGSSKSIADQQAYDEIYFTSLCNKMSNMLDGKFVDNFELNKEIKRYLRK